MFFLSRHHRDIVFYKAETILRSEASKTHLSFLWWIIDPILSMTVYYVVFGVLLQRGTEDFVAFLLVGLVTWQWFSNTVAHSAGSINNSVGLISQISFPKVILPSINIAVDAFKFSIVFALLLAFLLLYGFGVTLQFLWLPVILAVQYLFIMGCSYLLACALPFVPDLQHVISHLLRMAMYLSGVLYPIAIIPERLHDVFLANPMAFLIKCYRDVLMYAQTPDLAHLGLLAAFSLALAALGQLALRRMDKVFPRIVMQR